MFALEQLERNERKRLVNFKKQKKLRCAAQVSKREGEQGIQNTGKHAQTRFKPFEKDVFAT